MAPGNYESYWHFNHGGRRFGHWLGCSVIVDADEHSEKVPHVKLANPFVRVTDLTATNVPVDLTMKCPKHVASTTDDMKMFNSNVKTEKDSSSECNSVNIGKYTNKIF